LQVTAILTLLAISVYYFSSLDRKLSFQHRLKSRANYSAQLYTLFGDSSTVVLNHVDSSMLRSTLTDRIIAIFPSEGKPLFQFLGPDTLAFRLDSGVRRQVARAEEVYFNLRNKEAIAQQYQVNGKSFIVVVGAYDTEGFRRLGMLVKILIGSILAAMMLTALVGYWFSKGLVRPIQEIIHEVNDISSGNLSHRIPTEASGDELSQLADTFNGLLERLEGAFDMQRTFVSNASHELATPLTSISSQLEVVLQKEREPGEYKEVLVSIHDDVIQLRHLTHSLLEMARADTSGGIALSEVRVDEILLKVTSEMKKISARYRVMLEFGEFPEEEKDCVVFGSTDLLHSALRNMVENACKYADDKTAVVYLSYEDHYVIVRISNRGNLIAEADIQHLFQPFYRGTNARGFSGFGLGLALAKGITRMHKGNIQVQSVPGEGTVFTWQLPSLMR
jgi:two-component system, OmpR family, sensor histidine kinase ArlS